MCLSPQSSRVHITRAVLEQFLSFAKYLDGLAHGAPLLKQLCDHILFNPAIWIHTPAKVSVCVHLLCCSRVSHKWCLGLDSPADNTGGSAHFIVSVKLLS